MGMMLYTAGVVSITIGIYKLLDMIISSDNIMLGVLICISLEVIGVIGVIDGLCYMKRKGGR